MKKTTFFGGWEVNFGSSATVTVLCATAGLYTEGGISGVYYSNKYDSKNNLHYRFLRFRGLFGNKRFSYFFLIVQKKIVCSEFYPPKKQINILN